MQVEAPQPRAVPAAAGRFYFRTTLIPHGSSTALAASATWRFEAEEAAPNCTSEISIFCGYGASGINGVWTRVPGPSTLTLAAIGFVGLVGLHRLAEEKNSRAWHRLRFRRSSATGT